MDIIWGCDTEDMDELAERIVEGVERLRRLIELLRGTSASVAWKGPDATAHRERTAVVTSEASDLCGILRDRSRQLHEESAQQTRASRGGRGLAVDPFAAVRAEWPDLLPGGPMQPPDLEGGPPIGFRAPIDVDEMPAFPWPEGMGKPGPWIGGPFQRQDPIDPTRPLPDGESFGLTDDSLAHGEDWRRLLLKSTTYSALAQGAMDAHDAIGDGLDRAESALVDSGHEEFVPLVDAARVPHDGSSLVLGENSVLHEVTHGADRLLGNVDQTTTEVTEAVGDGDLTGALRAGERGVYRHQGIVSDVAVDVALPDIPAAAGDVAEHAAGAVEPISPDAAEMLREAGERSDALSSSLQETTDRMTDAEQWYDARRRYMPMPWDPQG
ncbi:MAG: hypothetical protein L0G94_03445 [Brachybacterium sp.]|uniref:hypothetical protein n=1 Tax=Brachybacterium sp. TaxID=1891286 RepID=UPI00264A3006|nr:hypothetical protein [Brachybacterium sp.]MDN5685725.1 hypothetical protein [Brachybacterium sp.]